MTLLMRPFRIVLLALVAALAVVQAGPAVAAPPEDGKKAGEVGAPVPPNGKRTRGSRRAPALQPVVGPLQATIGIADQKADVFADQRFRGLGMRHARRSVAWDALLYDWQVRDIDTWLRAARRAGVTPLITFARSRVAERRHLVPPPAQMQRAFRAFRARWPWVKDFAASNESNHYGEPTGRRPQLAARYYLAMKRSCPSCRILAADLLDFPNMVSWVRQFVKHAKEQPRYWGLHNYLSANRFQLARTRELLLATTGEVWLTEVGGLVKRRTEDQAGKAKLKEGRQHAAQVTRFIFQRLARLSPRIKRVYVYHWNSSSPADTWDSALVGHDGRPRPAFNVLASVMRTVRAARSARR